MSFSVTRYLFKCVKIKPCSWASTNNRNLMSKPIKFEYLKPEFTISPEEITKIREERETRSNFEKLLKIYGAKPLVLKQNPWILEEPIKEIEKKLDLIVIIKEIPLKSVNFGILKLDLKDIKCIDRPWHWKNNLDYSKIKYFQRELQLPYNKVMNLFKKHVFLQTRSYESLREIMEILKASGVEKDAMCKDMKVFRCNIDFIKARIKKITEENCVNVKSLKTWMISCSEDVLNKKLQRSKERMEVLGEGQDLIDYLSKRLECDQETVQLLCKKNPRLLKTSPLKVKKILDYLFKEGFTASQIKEKPKVFNCSLKTIEERMSDCKSLNYFPSTLLIFYYSKEEYCKLITKLESN